MTEIKYPKILVFGNRINLTDGGGITFYNLFKGWPKEKIAVVASGIDPEGIELCEKYYRLGYEENRRPWPLNKFQPYYESSEVILKKEDAQNTNLEEYKTKKSKYNSKRKSIITNLIHFSGLYHFLFPLKVSEKLLDWIKKENPDIMYTPLGLPDFTMFMRDVVRYINTPLVIHTMDDWITTSSKEGLSRLYWNRKVNKSFVELLNHATKLITICPTMSDEYKKRYGLEFISFQNCIDVDFWGKYQKKNWKTDGTFKILYAGRIGFGTSESVMQIARAVENLGKSGMKVEFQIQSRDLTDKYTKELNSFNHVKINSFLAYKQLPEKFSSVDLLVLPMDFDRKNLRFIRLSMPTKAPEYMISGTPIFVFAPDSTALAKYALNDKWAFAITKNKLTHIEDGLRILIENEKLRTDIAQRATKVALKNHKIEDVSVKFKEYLCNL